MSAGKLRPAATLAVVVVAILVVSMARPAAAQECPGPVVEFAAGSLLRRRRGSGGKLRRRIRLVHVLPRASVRPECFYSRRTSQPSDADWQRDIRFRQSHKRPTVFDHTICCRRRRALQHARIVSERQGLHVDRGRVHWWWWCTGFIGRHVVVGAEARIGCKSPHPRERNGGCPFWPSACCSYIVDTPRSRKLHIEPLGFRTSGLLARSRQAENKAHDSSAARQAAQARPYSLPAHETFSDGDSMSGQRPDRSDSSLWEEHERELGGRWTTRGLPCCSGFRRIPMCRSRVTTPFERSRPRRAADECTRASRPGPLLIGLRPSIFHRRGGRS